jgi:hypothetical protein
MNIRCHLGPTGWKAGHELDLGKPLAQQRNTKGRTIGQYVCAFLSCPQDERLGPEQRPFHGVNFGSPGGFDSQLSTCCWVTSFVERLVRFLWCREHRSRQAADMAARKSLIR